MKLTHHQLASRLRSVARQLELIAADSPLELDGLAAYVERLRDIADRASQHPKPLTEAQGRILAYIRSFFAAHDCAPTLREIAEGLSLSSPNAAHEHVVRLEARGYLTRTGEAARGIRLNKRCAL